VVREKVAHLEDDRYFAPDIKAAIALLSEGALAFETLPGVI
jgi:histidine ammonia-lyase